MKTGDLVKIVGSHAALVGTIVSQWRVEGWGPQEGWWEVLIEGGRVIHWPESQMELVDV